MARWAILRDGVVENVVEWDGIVFDGKPGGAGWTPPENRIVIPAPDFVWFVDGVYQEEGDPKSGLCPHMASPSKTWTYSEDGVWKDPANQWMFTYVNEEWVKEDCE